MMFLKSLLGSGPAEHNSPEGLLKGITSGGTNVTNTPPLSNNDTTLKAVSGDLLTTTATPMSTMDIVAPTTYSREEVAYGHIDCREYNNATLYECGISTEYQCQNHKNTEQCSKLCLSTEGCEFFSVYNIYGTCVCTMKSKQLLIESLMLEIESESNDHICPKDIMNVYENFRLCSDKKRCVYQNINVGTYAMNKNDWKELEEECGSNAPVKREGVVYGHKDCIGREYQDMDHCGKTSKYKCAERIDINPCRHACESTDGCKFFVLYTKDDMCVCTLKGIDLFYWAVDNVASMPNIHICNPKTFEDPTLDLITCRNSKICAFKDKSSDIATYAMDEKYWSQVDIFCRTGVLS